VPSVVITAPRPEWPDPGILRSIGAAGSPSRILILNGKGRSFAADQRGGQFSLKWIPRGRALYRTPDATHILSGDAWLLLNEGQDYELQFLDRAATESFCLFFSPPLLRDVQAGLALSDDAVIEGDVSSSAAGPPEFPEIVFRPDAALLEVCRAMRAGYPLAERSAAEIEETLLMLLGGLIATTARHRGLALRVPAAKPATRHALLRRLQRACDAIEDAPDRILDLDTLAAASGLSKFHLVRLFKAILGRTPLHYARECKVERAKALLRDDSRTIGNIAWALGYDSQSAFGRVFRRHTGLTPRAHRRL
jgi:AraC family transcriptional regulator